MEQQKSFSSALCLALVGFSLVIIVHECGHFIAARLLGIACPIFSIGFGPALISLLIGKTTFQLALIPLGGYVLVDPQQFNNAPYSTQCLITLAGIFFNLLFAYILFLILSINKNKYLSDEENLAIHHDHNKRHGILRHALSLYAYTFTHLNELAMQTFARGKRGIIGPIGIVKGLIDAAKDGAFLYLFSIAMLNINIAIFNFLPIPLLDGGKLVQITIEALFGKQPFFVILAISIFLLFLIITLFSYMQGAMAHDKTTKPTIDQK